MTANLGGADPPSSAPDSDPKNGRLGRLPDELLLQIFEKVGQESKRDLCNVSLTNRRYHGVADAVLYQSIIFESPEHHLTFSESLSRRPRRGSIIQDVKLEYPGSELSHLILDAPIHRSHYAPTRIDGLSRTISTMSNLETLEVSVPASLLHGIGTLFNGPFDLACLKSCTLFYQTADNEHWDLRENIHIFGHPTLENLTITRARLDHRGFESLERPEETALKRLHLIECDLNEDALFDILMFPEALKEFVLTQTEFGPLELEESSDDVEDYIISAKQAAESLETITIDFPGLGCRKALRMRDFTSLKTLRLSWDYQLFGKSSKKPRLHSVGLPPELETLEFFNELGTDEEVLELMTYAIQNKDVTARRFKTLIVASGSRGVPKEIIEACASQNVHLEIRGT